MGAPSGTVTFLFTDIEGSTRLWDEEPEMMRVALERHDAMVRAAIRDAGGVVFATGGDGFAAAFSRAGDALAASVAIQRALTRERWPNGVDLRVRVGVHTGEALERDGDYFGSAVNTASRLMTLSGPGQVLCSQATASLVDARGEWDLVDLGPVSLRGLASPVRAFGVIADGVRPPTALARDRPTGNLPRMSTEFVGREGELREVRRLLRPGRCLTLTGTGGVGKTRLAVEVASVAADAFSDGAWMVDLAAVSEPALVAAAAAQALLLRIPEGGAPLDAVVAAIAARRMVLVIDNCEHLLDACADFVERVTEVCSGVAVMATSREPLGLPGEQVCRVASLDPSRDAIELFVDRVRLVDPAFAPTAADLDTIQEMATRLDGIPLAIELAAARVRSLGLAGVLARLDDRFSLLRAGRRGRLERHQTLRATVAWSYQLLSQDEAAAFDGCAVFADGFDIDAARAVWGGGHDELEVVDRLEALVDKSMVTTDPSGRGARYHVLETLRQFAEERLFETGRLAEVSERHARHYVAVAEAAAAQFETPAEADAIAIFREEWGNLRTAFTWAVTRHDVVAAFRLVDATAMYALTTLRYEHQQWTATALALAGNGAMTAEVLSLTGMAAYWLTLRGDYEEAVRLSSRALSEASPVPEEARFWCSLALHMAQFALGDITAAAAAAEQLAAVTADASPYRKLCAAVMTAQASYVGGSGTRAAYEDVVRLADEIRSPSARSFAAGHRAMIAYLNGDRAAASELFREAVGHAHGAGLLTLEGGWMTGLAMALRGFSMDDAASAEALGSMLRHAAEANDGLSTWTGLEVLAIHLAEVGNLEPASVILGHLEAANRRTADLAADRKAAIDALHDYPEAAERMAHGARMSREALVEYAIRAATGAQ